MYAISIKCSNCGYEYSLNDIIYICKKCEKPLNIMYNYDSIKEAICRRDLTSRKMFTIWRYREFLPIKKMTNIVTLSEGFTPLLKSNAKDRLKLFKKLFFKLDSICPTGSFKDRGSSILISKAKELNRKIIAIDSSGNAAASIAGYSAKAGLKCYVFTPSYASLSKIIQTMVYGATVFAVNGTRNDTYETAQAAYQRFGWYYCGFQTNPYAIEGFKTTAYEICEQLNWNPPDKLIIPVGTGVNLIGCWKGFMELFQLGFITHLPSLICVQPEGCSPIAQAYKNGLKTVIPVAHPSTIAEGLMIGHPIRGEQVLKAISDTNGLAETVSDAEIQNTCKLLAKNEGIFVEPSAAVSVTGLINLVDDGLISKDEVIVCILTGSGLKTKDLYSEIFGKPKLINPMLGDLETLIHTKAS